MSDRHGLSFDFDEGGGSLGRRDALSWVEESFMFERPTGKQPAAPGSPAHIGSSFGRGKYLLFFTLFAAAFAAIGLRVMYLQIVHGIELRSMAEGNRQRIVPIPAERGLVWDSRGRQLTKNIPNFSLAVIPQNLPRQADQRAALVTRLSELTKRPETDIWQVLEEYGNYSYESIVIQEDLDYETALSIQIAAADLPGISIERGSKRLYIHDPAPDTTPATLATTTVSLSHIIGYEGKLTREELDALYAEGYLPSDLIGKSGIEKIYETYLRGVYGKKRVEVNANGREQSVLAETAPNPGYHIHLSIDAAMQQALEGTLRRALAEQHKSRGAAIALDPRNGRILAIVSLPTFDNNDFSGGITNETYQAYIQNPNRPLFNRSISGTYPSGSTIKPVIASAALQEGIIAATTVFLSNGGLQVGAWFFPDWRPGGHGWTSVVKSLADSVNTFYYYIGGGYGDTAGLGVERIVRYLEYFGFGKALGIDLPGEADGFLPSIAWKEEIKQEPWYIGDTYNLSIGQGDLLVTPLQIAAMTGAVANGGVLYRPQVVQAIEDPVAKQKTMVTPSVIRSQVVDAGNLQIVRRGMQECVKTGSCRRLNSLPFASAGKTGTAQWRSDRDTHAWFTSFAPYENPEIVVTVLIEEGGEGSSAAVPVADAFYRWWWSYQAARS